MFIVEATKKYDLRSVLIFYCTDEIDNFMWSISRFFPMNVSSYVRKCSASVGILQSSSIASILISRLFSRITIIKNIICDCVCLKSERLSIFGRLVCWWRKIFSYSHINLCLSRLCTTWIVFIHSQKYLSHHLQNVNKCWLSVSLACVMSSDICEHAGIQFVWYM